MEQVQARRALQQVVCGDGRAGGCRHDADDRSAVMNFGNAARLCKNSVRVALCETTTRQIASGSIFWTSPRVERPPNLLGNRVFTLPPAVAVGGGSPSDALSRTHCSRSGEHVTPPSAVGIGVLLTLPVNEWQQEAHAVRPASSSAPARSNVCSCPVQRITADPLLPLTWRGQRPVIASMRPSRGLAEQRMQQRLRLLQALLREGHRSCP